MAGGEKLTPGICSEHMEQTKEIAGMKTMLDMVVKGQESMHKLIQEGHDKMMEELSKVHDKVNNSNIQNAEFKGRMHGGGSTLMAIIALIAALAALGMKLFP